MFSKIAVTFLTALVLGIASLSLIEQAGAAPRRLDIAPGGSFGLPLNEVMRDRNCATGLRLPMRMSVGCKPPAGSFRIAA